MLGVEVAEADPEDNEFTVEDEETGREVKYVIPEYPFPFFRGKNGGIYRKGDDTESEAEKVYEHDFYLVKRMRDPALGEVALFRLHLPHDGIKEFTLPAATICSKDSLRGVLAEQGIITFKGQGDNLAMYVVTALKNSQFEKRAEMMRTQFGWVDGDSKF